MLGGGSFTAVRSSTMCWVVRRPAGRPMDQIRLVPEPEASEWL